VQFGIDVSADGRNRSVPLRSKTGQLLARNQRKIDLPLPTRSRRADVIDVLRLRDALADKALNLPPSDGNVPPIAQTGSASFAIAVLDPPWRQRFEGTEDKAGDEPAPMLPGLKVTDRARDAGLKLAVSEIYKLG